MSYFNFSIPTAVLVSYFRYVKVRESLDRTITGRQRTTKTNSFGAKFQNGGAKQYSGPRIFPFLLVEKNLSYSEILEEIKSHFPDFKGCSLRSLKRFCSQHEIKKQMPVSDEVIDVAVRSAVSEVSYTVFIRGFQG